MQAVDLVPNATYFARVVARNSTGTVESDVVSFTVTSDPVFRYASRQQLATHTPEMTFADGALPWVDLDDVFHPAAPPLLFYDFEIPGTVIAVVKDQGRLIVQSK